MVRFLAIFLSVLLVAFPALADCPPRPTGGYAFPARLADGVYSYELHYRLKSFMGKSCWSPQHLEYYALYEDPTSKVSFVAVVGYFEGKPSTYAHFFRGFYSPETWLAAEDERNVFAGEFENEDLGCCRDCINSGFVTCVANQFSTKFPFDIVSNLPADSATCPKISVGLGSESRDFDFCWIYQAMRPLKYAIALSLIIKLFIFP